jgi:hypothetical protein
MNATTTTTDTTTTTTAKTAEVIRSAQAGVLLDDFFPSSPRAESRRRARRRTKTAAQLVSLSEQERELVVSTFSTLVEGLYTHLPLKKAMYAADPVQALRLLAQRASSLDDLSFHHEAARILTSLRDAHTRYLGPVSLAGHAAMLPFLVEAHGAPPDVRYIVSKVASDRSLIGDRRFVAGVELVWWNAVPIDRAVQLHAERETGGRADARRARAVESLTLRALRFGPPPDERWVDIGYLDRKGTEREVRIPWRAVTPKRARTASQPRESTWEAYALDPAAETTRRVKKLLFAPEQWLADHHGRPRHRAGTAKQASRVTTPVKADQWLESAFQDNVSAKVVKTPSGRFGYLRLWSFDLADDAGFVDEVARLLGVLPDTGLIVDLRGNPGGLIWAAERILQLLGPGRGPIEPTRFSLVATPLTRAMAAAAQNKGELQAWRQSLEEAVANGEPYSQALPITPPELCNDVGQVYGGPVVAVVDPNTYSAGDLFAAGFVDNELGTLVTVGEATGAGGANVWMPEQVEDALLGTRYELMSLPAGIGYSISVRRATRAGASDGLVIEDVGVRGHRTYAMTEHDLVRNNEDLLAFCGEILAAQPSTAMRATADDDEVVVESRGLDRLDVYVDDRPQGSLEVTGGTTTVAVPAGWSSIELVGFAGDQLRQRRHVRR